jgi:hypothetical protein
MIPHLEDLSIAQRIMLTAVIVIVILLLMALVGFVSGRWETAEGQESPLWSPKYEPRFIELDKLAIEEAYKKHIIRLFDIWVTDYDSKKGEPPRAVHGAINARGAYARSMDAIERRERALPTR